jgi:hypothetical protein
MQKEQNAIIFFASITPQGFSDKKCSERIKDYSRSLEILSRYAAELQLQLRIVENTLSSKDAWVDSGMFFEEGLAIDFISENSGLHNKGIGELDMAAFVLSKWDITKFKKVIWFSGRHILTSENSLNRCLNSLAEVVVSNPDFYFLDGDKQATDKEGFLNDMMFAMSGQIFKNYISTFESRRTELVDNNVGSEQLLHQFVKDNELTVDWMMHLGVLRREYVTKWRWLETSQWHFC